MVPYSSAILAFFIFKMGIDVFYYSFGRGAFVEFGAFPSFIDCAYGEREEGGKECEEGAIFAHTPLLNAAS